MPCACSRSRSISALGLNPRDPEPTEQRLDPQPYPFCPAIALRVRRLRGVRRRRKRKADPRTRTRTTTRTTTRTIRLRLHRAVTLWLISPGRQQKATKVTVRPGSGFPCALCALSRPTQLPATSGSERFCVLPFTPDPRSRLTDAGLAAGAPAYREVRKSGNFRRIPL
jgi:hypothetical protein